MSSISKPLDLDEVYYPEGDGKPMAETDIHYREMTVLKFALDQRYRDEPEVYVAANLLFYFTEGRPADCVAPDVFAVFGIPKGDRRIYKLWVEKRPPDVVFELTSPSTQEIDLAHKRLLYERLGVTEYFLFDPLGQYLRPTLQAFRREGPDFLPLLAEPLPGREWKLRSRALGLELITNGSRLRLFDPESQEFLRTPDEEAEARRQEAEARRREAEARRIAEARLARESTALRAAEEELAWLRKELESRPAREI